jgi:hypothetical protein
MLSRWRLAAVRVASGTGFLVATAAHLPAKGPPVEIESVQYQANVGQELSFAFPEQRGSATNADKLA